MKSNYAKCGEEIRLEWEDGHFVVAEEGPKAVVDYSKRSSELALILALNYPEGGKVDVPTLVKLATADGSLTHMFDGCTSPRRQRDRIISLLREGVQTADHKWTYELNQKKKPSHWAVAKEQKLMDKGPNGQCPLESVHYAKVFE
jgi:hypothetical protein